jgi:RNase P subunit RPR2
MKAEYKEIYCDNCMCVVEPICRIDYSSNCRIIKWVCPSCGGNLE